METFSGSEYEGLPGAELVVQGIRDLQGGGVTEAGLLVMVASPRLKALGLPVPVRSDIQRPYEHKLYEYLEETHGRAAYSRYNSLIRRIVSFSRTLEAQRSRESAK